MPSTPGPPWRTFRPCMCTCHHGLRPGGVRARRHPRQRRALGRCRRPGPVQLPRSCPPASAAPPSPGSASTATTSAPGIRTPTRSRPSAAATTPTSSPRRRRETFGVENVVARIYDPARRVYQRLGIPTVAASPGRPTRSCAASPESAGDEWRDGRQGHRGSQPRSRRVGRHRVTSQRESGARSPSHPVRRGRHPRRRHRGAGRRPRARAHRPVEARRAPAVFGGPGGPLMRVAIAGAGRSGAPSPARAALNGHHPAHRPRPGDRRVPASSGRRSAGDTCEIAVLDQADLPPARCRDRRHRRRQGQPRRLAAGQDRVRRPPCRRAREPPEERVDVRRGVGRRRRGVDAADALRARRGRR